MQTLYAHTENHHPLPAYVNVSQDGGPDAPVTISVRQRGEDYAKTMTVHAGIARAMAETLAEKLNQPGSGC